MIDLNVDDVVSLQCDEHMIEDALLGPAVGACINRVPIAEFFGNPRHLQPCSATYKMALSTCKLDMETLSLCFGSNFSMTLKSADVIFMDALYQQ